MCKMEAIELNGVLRQIRRLRRGNVFSWNNGGNFMNLFLDSGKICGIDVLYNYLFISWFQKIIIIIAYG